jgi:hypothetical protein
VSISSHYEFRKSHFNHVVADIGIRIPYWGIRIPASGTAALVTPLAAPGKMGKN